MIMRDVWQSAQSYEAYIGRWSREVARHFVAGLPLRGGVWLDVGCGSCALTSSILSIADPARVIALDRSIEFVDHGRHVFTDERTAFVGCDAASLPLQENIADAAVSGLVLNFVPDPHSAVREMLRCVRPGAVVAAYLWDYSEGMRSIRLFWDAAIALDPRVASLDEANRF